MEPNSNLLSLFQPGDLPYARADHPPDTGHRPPDAATVRRPRKKIHRQTARHQPGGIVRAFRGAAASGVLRPP